MNWNEPKGVFHASPSWQEHQLRLFQQSKLKQILQHAYSFSPFYRARFDRAGLHPAAGHEVKVLSELPILTKADIQNSMQDVRAAAPGIVGATLNSTGGSTGTPLNFYQDDNYRLWADAARERAWRRHDGVSRNAIEAVLWGADRDVGRGFSLRRIARDLLRYRVLQLNTFDLDPETIKKYFRVYNLARPQILRGYASSLYFIANFIEANRLRVRPPRIIVSSAETLWPIMREKISSVFEADVIDSYGCREVSQIATECRCHNGLHIVMENQYVEVVDGQVLVTNLNNFAMPFIRYQVGDLADGIDTAPCACGRHSHRLMGLRGRESDLIEFPNGRSVHGEFFTHLFYGVSTVKQFQVVYSREEQRLRVRLAVTDRSQHIDELVKRRMADCFEFHNVTVEFSDEFDKTPTGKFRFVYSVDRLEKAGQHVA